MASQQSFLKNSYPTFADRLALLADLVGNMNKLCLRSGQSAGGLQHYLKGGEPTRPVLENLAKATGVLSSFLVDGRGPIRAVSSDTRTALVQRYLRFCNAAPDGDQAKARSEFVRQYNNEVITREPQLAKLSLYELNLWLHEFYEPRAEQGVFIPIPHYDLDAVDEGSFSADARAAAQRAAMVSLRRGALEQWKLDPKQVAIFIVHSRDPLLKPGDWVLCDCRSALSRRNGLYVVKEQGYYAVRRVQFLSETRVRLFWTNPEVDDSPEATAECALDQIELIGRAVLFIRRLRN